MTTYETVCASSRSAWWSSLVLRTSVWSPSAQATCVACHKIPVHPRGSSPSAPASLTVVQGAGGFPWLGHRGRWLAQALVWRQQDLQGCSRGAKPPARALQMGEESSVVMAEDQAQCWEMGEEQCPLLLVLLGV